MPSFLKIWLRIIPSFVIAGMLSFPAQTYGQAPSAASIHGPAANRGAIAALPLTFAENDGQFLPKIAFLGQSQSYSVAIERDRLHFLLPGSGPGSAVDVQFAGSSNGNPVSLSGAAYRSNYFIGADQSKWRTGVPNFERVGIREIYPGIDTEFYEKNGELEHDFILAPGADANAIRLILQSAGKPALTAEGDAVIPATAGELRFRKPVAYQFDAEGRRISVAASYHLVKSTLGIKLGDYDRSRTLVIDPVITFATYITGTSGSTGAQLAADSSGATLFLVGSTPSSTGFPSAGSTTNDKGTGPTNVFVAALTTSQLGSAIKWITFLGNTGTSTGTSIAYSSHGSDGTLYVGGQTSETSFPGVGSGRFGGTFPNAGSTTGFVTSLDAVTGAAPTSTYISTSAVADVDKTSITGLAADTAGDVFISGYGLGVDLTPTANSLGGSAIVPSTAGTMNNAFVIELDPALDTNAKLVTYLQSITAGDYRATAIQVDATGQIYVAGTMGVSGKFPSSKSFAASAPIYTAANDIVCQTDSTRVFLAQIQPGTTANSVLGYSLLTCGAETDTDTLYGMALGASAIYLTGTTTAADMYADVDYSLPSLSGNSTAAGNLSGLQTTFVGTLDGYVLKVPLSGSPLVAAAPSAFTYIGGATQADGMTSASTTLNGVAIDDTNHLLQLIGQTNASRAALPITSGASGLPPGSPQDPLAETARAILYTFDDSASPFLNTVKSVSNLSGATTGIQGLSVLPDSAAGAYILTQDTLGTSGASFTSSDAAGAAVPSQPNAFIADIQGTNVAALPAPGLAFAAATSNNPEIDGTPCTGTDCVIGYDPTDNTNISSIQYSWSLSAAADATDVVLNFLPEPMLSRPYVVNEDGTQLTSCATAVTVPVSNGTTCIIPALSAGAHTITLTANASAAASPTATPNPIGTTFQLAGTAADAEGEYQNAPQTTVTVGNPIQLSLTLTQSLSTVDAANGAGDTGSTGHTTQVIYTAKVTNSSTYDSPNTTLKITPPSGTAYHIVSAVSSIATGCQNDGSGCTKVDVPAGATLTYTITAEYLAAGLGTTTPGPIAEQLSASAFALPRTPKSTPADVSVSTNVNGYAALSVAFIEPTYTTGQTAFNLNSGALTYKVTLTNNGPNASGAFSLANTVPTGFAITSSSCAPTNAVTASCDTANGTGFAITSINSGGTVVYTLNGSFPDKGTAADAVPQNAANATVKDSVTLTAPTGTYDPNALTAVSTGVVVQRSVHLKLSLTTSTTSLAGTGYTAPAYNLGTAISYVYTINNSGPNIAVGVPLTAVITPPTGYSPLAGYVTVTSLSSGVTCATDYTSCTVTSVAAGTTQLTFTVTYPDKAPSSYPVPPNLSAVPTALSNATYTYGVTLPVTYYSQGGGPTPIAVDSNPAGTTTGDNTTSYSVNIYRTVHLTLSLANSGTNANGGSYVQPAYNLGSNVTYTYTLKNDGPNNALNVPLTSLISPPSTYVPLPPPSAYAVMPPTVNGLVCTSGYASCVIGAVLQGPTPTTLAFTAAYPDIAPSGYQWPTQENLSAVPSDAKSAAYNYNTQYGTISNAINTATSGNSDSNSVNIYRTSALTLTPSVAGPRTPCTAQVPTSCLFMANSGNGTGLNDTATYTVAINNAGPDLATNTVLTIPLPTNFLVTANPSVAFSGIADTGVANQLVCTYDAPSNSVICKGYVPTGASTATVTSKFSTTAVPANAAFTTTATAPNTPGSGSVTASAINANNSTTLPAVTIYRAAQLVAAKVVAPAPGNVSPNGFAANGVTAVNLDEKIPGDANGKNDTIQITQQVGNAGLNDAVSVVVTDTLPSFFILTKLPDPSIASCTVSGPTTMDSFGHPMTGAAVATLTCTLQNPVPRGTATAGVGTTHGTVSGAFAQIVYYGKFEDNGLQADAIPLTQSSALLSFGTLKAMSADEVDLGTGADTTSAAIAPLPVMRAAHLHFTLTQYVQPNDAALNPVGGVTGPGIAEAQPGASGGEVINPVRYQVRVTNDGPNIATDPIVNTTLPLNPGGAPTKFVNIAQSIEPSSTPGFPTVPANCATGMACDDGGVISTGASLLYNVDGNFDINTLTEGNFGTRNFASAITTSGLIDSNPSATAGGAQQTSLPITVVNTPVGANVSLNPTGTTLGLSITTVQVAGITSLQSGAALPALPSGPSPNPPDNGATKPLYRFGQNAAYYTLGTTASVPSGNSNPVSVCLTAIPDTFQKPERALLWALANAPGGTRFNTVPHYTSNGTAGDITSLVLPQGGATYSAPVSNTTYPPPAGQPQPAEVCGVLNGLASATAPTSIAILEPVNYAPYIRTAITAANSTNSQPGKGVTAAAANVDLTISPQNNYDYNDQDPCYTGGNGTQRNSCNDNLQVTTFLFGGGNLIGDAQQVHTYFYSDLQSQPKPQFNLPAGQPQLYVVLADQLGAQGYKEATSGGNTQVCDPGTPSTSYVPTTPTCPLPTPLPTAAAVPPAQTILPLSNDTSVEVAILSGSVGFGGSSGLIPLPETPTPEAIANVSAGQTAGFVWNWLTQRPEVQGIGGGAPPVLTLACTSADGTDLASVGIQCNIPQTYVYSTGSGSSLLITPPPAIYVITRSNSAVGALHEGPLNRDLQVVAAIVFPLGAIPLFLLARRRKALKLSGWLAVVFFASLVGMSIGCGSSSFKNMGGTTTTATPANTYQFIVTASGTASDGTAINIKSYPFAVTVSAVQ